MQADSEDELPDDDPPRVFFPADSKMACGAESDKAVEDARLPCDFYLEDNVFT